jgi:NAD(P)-dependent dehydrogenase (short-subunit alcohol dehydrogenase family)
MAASKSVLITGCSSGIGRVAAEHLAARGWKVYATARRVEAIKDLEPLGCTLLPLDVTDEASMRAAVAAVEEREGAVGVLVNNAGYSQSGAVESIPLDQMRQQFETNVFGLSRMCQLVLPGMRRQGWGRIVNISSVGGRLTFPGGGAYHATKHAVEAISDALRFEVQSFGVDVVVIEPGLIITRFGDTAAASVEGTASEGAYADFNAAVAKVMFDAYKGPLARAGIQPSRVAQVIEKAISRRRPRPRYVVPAPMRVALAMRRLFPDRVWDWFLTSTFPRPVAPPSAPATAPDTREPRAQEPAEPAPVQAPPKEQA